MRRNPITDPPVLPLVAPSILSADFANMERDCRAAMDAGADLLHVDVMDGHFAPNLTIGPPLCAALRRAFPQVCLDAHLMITNPADFVEPFANAGVDHLTFHVEAHDDPTALAQRIRDAGMSAGLALNPPTPVDAVVPYMDAFDLILVMSVNPGFSGQSFMPEVLDKVSAIAARLRSDQRLEMDGGVAPATAARCRAAGCDLLVGGSAIFGAPDLAKAIVAMRGDVSGAPGLGPTHSTRPSQPTQAAQPRGRG